MNICIYMHYICIIFALPLHYIYVCAMQININLQRLSYTELCA